MFYSSLDKSCTLKPSQTTLSLQKKNAEKAKDCFRKKDDRTLHNKETRPSQNIPGNYSTSRSSRWHHQRQIMENMPNTPTSFAETISEPYVNVFTIF